MCPGIKPKLVASDRPEPAGARTACLRVAPGAGPGLSLPSWASTAPLLRIKRCCLTGRVIFGSKADAERVAGHLSLDDVLEAVVNAPAIYKTLRSRSTRRAARNERLYVIVFIHP